MKIGTRVTFALDIPYVGKRSGLGEIAGPGQFPILGETYTVRVIDSPNYKMGDMIEAKRSSLRAIG